MKERKNVIVWWQPQLQPCFRLWAPSWRNMKEALSVWGGAANTCFTSGFTNHSSKSLCLSLPHVVQIKRNVKSISLPKGNETVFDSLKLLSFQTWKLKNTAFLFKEQMWGLHTLFSKVYWAEAFRENVIFVGMLLVLFYYNIFKMSVLFNVKTVQCLLTWTKHTGGRQSVDYNIQGTYVTCTVTYRI